MSGLNRVNGITRHLTNADTSQSKSKTPPNWNDFAAATEDQPDAFLGILDKIPNFMDIDGYDISQHLAGPLTDKETYPNGWMDVFAALRKWGVKGDSHVAFVEFQKLYGGKQGLSSNMAFPMIVFGREGPNDSGPRSMPEVHCEVVISHPDDARRIARMHVEKNPIFTPLFFNSIISTTDNEEWKYQREHLVSSFLPKGALEKVFPVTLQRAKDCAKRLESIRTDKEKEEGFGVVNMNDFLLYETEAQLQLALFGMKKEFMEETNEKFRQSMAGTIEPMYARKFCDEIVENINSDQDISGPVSAGVSSQCPVKGPLSDGLKTLETKGKGVKGNAFIFAFAGHDTTGHTLTWLIYELCKNPEIQARLQAEIDGFFQELGGRDMTYADLTKLPFMTRCIMETLRLWPAVANGTFRRIQFDDYIKGPDGKDVLIKKGTYCRIVNWSRHRNPDLWGPDVETFNPDREFQPDELWNGDVLRGYNPQTERFSPFTFTPRDCIGKNFAQMEMRAILCYILRDYSFELTEPHKNVDPNTYLGVNYGTLAPRDMHKPPLVKSFPGWGPGIKTPTGMRMIPIPRRK